MFFLRSWICVQDLIIYKCFIPKSKTNYVGKILNYLLTHVKQVKCLETVETITFGTQCQIKYDNPKHKCYYHTAIYNGYSPTLPLPLTEPL